MIEQAQHCTAQADMWQSYHHHHQQAHVQQAYMHNMPAQQPRQRPQAPAPPPPLSLEYSSGDEEDQLSPPSVYPRHPNILQHSQQSQQPPQSSPSVSSADPAILTSQQSRQSRVINNMVADDATAHASTARASRNMAEKQRRDNLNTQIGIISTLVPFIPGDNAKRRDKISILRLAAAQLRISHALGKELKKIIPVKYNNFDVIEWIVNQMCDNSGFFIILTSVGNITYVSKQVERHLGYDQRDMLAQSIKNFVYEADHEALFRGLTPDESCMPANDEPDEPDSSSDEQLVLYNGSGARSRRGRPQARRHKYFREQRRSFYVRMAQRLNSRRENPQYEYVHLFGTLRLAEECRENEAKGNPWTPENCSSNDVIFCGFARLLKKKTVPELSVLDANKNEYFTRHLIDGRIIYCDHRISLVAGYMSEEVSGTSAFTFMHKEDVKWTVVALRHMYTQGINFGSSCYRLMTKTGEYIYLRTHGYLEWDEESQAVSSFVCINTLISKEEGEKLICEMKERFSATFSTTNFKALLGMDVRDFDFETDSLSRNDEPLEDVITCLISDLPTSAENTDAIPPPDEQAAKAVNFSKQLPPASIQASKIGIDNSYPCIGKNGKGKQSPGGKKAAEESSMINVSKNGEKPRIIADKKIPELEDSLSPIAASEKSPLMSEHGFLSPNPSESGMSYSNLDGKLKASQKSLSSPITGGESFSPSLDVQTNDNTGYDDEFQRTENSAHLKRSRYDSLVENIPVKRKVNNDGSEPSSTKKHMNFPVYVQSEEVDTVAVELPEDQYINFNDKQLLGTNIDNSEMIKLFSTDVPSSIPFEGSLEEENIHQYSAGDVRNYVNSKR